MTAPVVAKVEPASASELMCEPPAEPFAIAVPAR
jgi:hypothetical protein